MERVIEERARGDAGKARIARQLRGTHRRRHPHGGAGLARRRAKLKEALIADGLWSQYLEVAIGPDAEVFTKAPPLSSVGWGD